MTLLIHSNNLELGASHTLIIGSGKTLFFSDFNSGGKLKIGGHTLTIKGGGELYCESEQGDIMSSEAQGVLNLQNITVKGLGGLDIGTINVNSGATIDLAKSAATDLLKGNINVNEGGAININSFTEHGITLFDGQTLTINGGTVHVKKEYSNNGHGINVGAGAMLVYKSGTLIGDTGASIWLAETAKVKGMNDKLQDQENVLNANGNGEVEVTGENDDASTTGLTQGAYIWDGERFSRPISTTGWRMNGGILTILNNNGMDNWTNNGLSANKEKVTSVIISEGVVIINRGAFSQCNNLTSIVIPKTMRTIGNDAFSGTGLTTFEVPAGVTTIVSPVFTDTKIERFSVAGGTSFKTDPAGTALLTYDGVKLIAFAPAYNQAYRIPGSVKTIGAKSFSNTQLTSVTLPANVTLVELYAFADAKQLATVTIERTTPPAFDSEVFKGTSSLNTIYVPKDAIDKYKEALQDQAHKIQGIDFSKGWTYKDGTLTITTDAGMQDWISSDKTDKEEITTLIIGDGVTSIPDDSEKGAFRDCTNLTTVSIGTGVKSIGQNAFYSCNSLKSIIIPGNVTEIKKYAFYNCRQLSSIEFKEGLTLLSHYIFVNCSELTRVTLPSTLDSIHYDAFQNSRLTDVEINGQGGTYRSKNGVVLKENTVYRCPPRKKTYTVPDGVTEIGDNAFSSCVDLTEITIPEGVTKIGNAAFYYTKLTDVTIPTSMKEIGYGAFSVYKTLATITFLGNTPPNIGENAFQKANEATTIYVPKGTIAAYTTALSESVPKATIVEESAKLILSNNIKEYPGRAFTVKAGDKEITAFPARLQPDTTITITLLPGYTMTEDWKYNETPLTPAGNVMTFEMPDKDVTISVTSIKPTSYTITYIKEKQDELEGLTPVSFTIEDAFPITLPADPTYDDNIFKGWYTDATFTGDAVTQLTAFTPAALTFYAKWSKVETVGEGETATISDDGATVKTDGATAGSITLEATTVTFEEVKTEKTEISAGQSSELTLTGSNELGEVSIPSTGSLTLRAAAEGASFTATTVENNGTLVDSTATITEVTGDGALIITPPASSPQIPYNSSSLTLTLSDTEGATSTLQKQAGDEWENVGDVVSPVTQSTTLRNTTALRSTATVTISEPGTYRVIVTKTDVSSSASTTLFTRPFTVTKGTQPYVPPTYTYYTVTLPEVEGATLSHAAGSHTIEEGNSLTFTITLDAAYSESVPVVTTDRGETIEPETDGRYRIRNIREDIIVSITGIVRNIPTAIETVESGTKVWAANGTILVRTAAPQQMQVFSLAGSTVISRNIPAGDTRIEGLTAGLYIVRLSDGTIRKVAIRK